MPRKSRPAPAPSREPFQLGEAAVQAGRRQRLELPFARFPTGEWAHLSVDVFHGARPGPTMFVAAAIHGDELNGIEIVRRVLELIKPRELAGTVLAVPMVNVFGVLHASRYLPDRRDLNRCFPGSSRGSMASRLAHLFMEQIVVRCDFGIDLHTGSNHRSNMPQIRYDFEDGDAARCADAFAAPVTMHSAAIRGSLRAAARRSGVPVILYEAGEAQRFDQNVIEAGVGGVLRVLEGSAMLAGVAPPPPHERLVCRSSRWARAGRSGLVRLQVALGQRVERGQLLGYVGSPLESRALAVRCPEDGLVVGVLHNPVVHRGEALVHVATTSIA